MNLKETDSRLAEAMREKKPPMLRCWVNEHSQAMLFPEEAHVILEGIDGRVDWNVVPKEKIVYLGVSKKGDAIGPFRDAYVHVSIFPQYSDDEGYFIQLMGCDAIRMKVPRDDIVFAQPKDPIWEEIKTKLEEETKGETPEFRSLSNDKIAIDLSQGSYVLMEEEKSDD